MTGLWRHLLETPRARPLDDCRVLMIDGPDGTGKTTYARYVAAEYGAIYMHRGRPTPGTTWQAEHLDPVLAALDDGHKVVMDRGPVGNPIWTHLFNDPESALFKTMESYLWCMSTFGFIGARVEIVLRRPADIATELTARGEPPSQIAAAVASVEEFEVAHETIKRAIPTRLLSSDLTHNYIQQHQQQGDPS